jgi:triosephosphate isomerase
MKPLVAGNWKMHLTRAEGAELGRALLRSLPTTLENADVALFPPFTCIADVVEAVAGSDVTVGAQNFYPEAKGAYTGEIAPCMLLDVGAIRVLVGHSERRHVIGEQDPLLNRKMHVALDQDMLPILCVGEKLEEREAGATAAVVDRQIRAGLEGIPASRSGDVTIAYEPVWAIGTGLTATTAQAGEVHAQIRALLAEIWGEAGGQVRILYGGSVKPDNARELMATPDINGVLVGGASLKADSFAAIVAAAG